MNVLVIGSGGREHAITKVFSESNLVKNIFCIPGNAGIAQLAKISNLDTKNHSEILHFAIKNKIDLVFIGPEDPLVNGLSDYLRENDILVFGPSKEAAQLEGSKIFAKDFMRQAEVPTANSEVVTTVDETMIAAKNYSAPYILKADGLAAGKGVFICKDLAELKSAAESLFVKKIFGAAGERALLEQNLPGKEISFLVLTNGKEFQALPLAQDHKRLLDENHGPNTGGMGTVAPLKIDSALYDRIISKVIAPSIKNLERNNFLYRGVLFVGLMIVENEPFVLEYNVRFGDPETQVILPLIENDLAAVFRSLAKGEIQNLHFNNLSAVCIVNAANGYPDSPLKNTPISLPDNSQNQYVLHAGTKLLADQKIVSNGGRVLNILGISNSYDNARKIAYDLNSKIVFEGRQFRTDIGKYL